MCRMCNFSRSLVLFPPLLKYLWTDLSSARAVKAFGGTISDRPGVKNLGDKRLDPPHWPHAHRPANGSAPPGRIYGIAG